MDERIELAIAHKERVRGCHRCGLRATANSPVPFSGPVPAKYVVVGEAPGKSEDERGTPLIGKSGQLLRTMLKEAGIESEVAYTNVARCWPGPGNPNPAQSHINACRRHLSAELSLLQPHVIIPVGRIALHQFRPDLQISKVSGRPLYLHHSNVSPDTSPISYFPWTPYILLLPLYHPAYLLRNRGAKKSVKEALQWLSGTDDYLAAWPNDTCLRCSREVARYDPHGLGWCAQHGEAPDTAAEGDARRRPARAG